MYVSRLEHAADGLRAIFLFFFPQMTHLGLFFPKRTLHNRKVERSFGAQTSIFLQRVRGVRSTLWFMNIIMQIFTRFGAAFPNAKLG